MAFAAGARYQAIARRVGFYSTRAGALEGQTLAAPARIVPAQWALALGALDTSVVLAYAAGVNPILWHLGTLALKGGLFALLRPRDRVILLNGAPFLAIILLFIGLSAATTMEMRGLLQAGGFLAHLTLTLALLRPDLIRHYAGAVAVVGAGAAALHVLGCLAGLVYNAWGRFYYLGNSHPNLGGEINALCVLAAAIGWRKIPALALASVLIISILLMQSRAALVAALGVVTMLIVFNSQGRLSLRRVFALAAMGIAAVTAGGLLGLFGSVEDLINQVLLLDDPYRGTSTGFVGRDERWAAAWGLFTSHPFFGVGLAYFEAYPAISPHNFFLFALAQHGAAALLLFAVLVVYLYRVFARSRFDFFLILPAFTLFLFNDRLMNINPYPFCVYVFLVTLSVSARASAQAHAAAPSAPTPRPLISISS